MEEIGNTEAIQREILEEARKTAEKMLREADEEVARTAAFARERASAARDEVAKSAESWIGRHRAETLARVPLEKIRYKTDLVDRRVRAALGEFFGGLGEDRIVGLVEGLMRPAAGQFKGREVSIRFRGLGKARAAAAVKAALGVAEPKEAVEDKSLPAAGLVVTTTDGLMTLRATVDLVESDLLDKQRGELARSLCAEALKA